MIAPRQSLLRWLLFLGARIHAGACRVSGRRVPQNPFVELLDEYCSLFWFLPVFGGGDREPARALDLRHAGRVLESCGADVVAAAANSESGCVSGRLVMVGSRTRQGIARCSARRCVEAGPMRPIARPEPPVMAYGMTRHWCRVGVVGQREGA